MSRQHRAALSTIECLLQEISSEIVHSSLQSRKLLSQFSSPTISPRTQKRPFTPRAEKLPTSPGEIATRLKTAGEKSERKKDAARVEVWRERRGQEQALAAIRRKRGAKRPCAPVEDRLRDFGRTSAVKKERAKRVANAAKAPLPFKPKLDSESLAIMQRLRPNDCEAVEDRLLRLGRRIHALASQKTAEIMQNPQEPGALEAVERLLQYQQIYRDHRTKLAKGKNEKPSFAPKLDKCSAEIMARKGKLAINRPKSVEKVICESQTECTFRPLIDPQSRRIAELKGTASERLLTPFSTKSQTEYWKECTFRPQINEGSRGSQSPVPRWQSLYEHNREKMEMQATRRFQQASCTPSFHPHLSAPSPKPPAKPVVTRLLSWGKERIEKLRKLQRDKLSPELEECTFAPSKFAGADWMLATDSDGQYWGNNHGTFSPSSKSLTPKQSIEDHLRLDTRESLALVNEDDSVDLEKLLRQLQGGDLREDY